MASCSTSYVGDGHDVGIVSTLLYIASWDSVYTPLGLAACPCMYDYISVIIGGDYYLYMYFFIDIPLYLTMCLSVSVFGTILCLRSMESTYKDSFIKSTLLDAD